MRYDEKRVKELIGKCPNIRENLNALVQFIQMPVKNCCEIFQRVDMCIKEATTKIPQKAEYNSLIIRNTFILSILGNLMTIFHIDKEEMERLVKESIEQIYNMDKQENNNEMDKK